MSPKVQKVKKPDGSEEHISNAGCVQIMEAKLLAFPVRSLAGCFAWLTCPAALARFQRDTGLLKHADSKPLPIPQPAKEKVIAGSDLLVNGQVVFEEFALDLERSLKPETDDRNLIEKLAALTSDPLWTGKIGTRLAVVHDENFQHFGLACIATQRTPSAPARCTIVVGTLTTQSSAATNAAVSS